MFAVNKMACLSREIKLKKCVIIIMDTVSKNSTSTMHTCRSIVNTIDAVNPWAREEIILSDIHTGLVVHYNITS